MEYRVNTVIENIYINVKQTSHIIVSWEAYVILIDFKDSLALSS